MRAAQAPYNKVQALRCQRLRKCPPITRVQRSPDSPCDLAVFTGAHTSEVRSRDLGPHQRSTMNLLRGILILLLGIVGCVNAKFLGVFGQDDEATVARKSAAKLLRVNKFTRCNGIHAQYAKLSTELLSRDVRPVEQVSPQLVSHTTATICKVLVLAYAQHCK
jgi:hypothetical protein